MARVDTQLSSHGAIEVELDARRAVPLATLINAVRDSACWRELPRMVRLVRALAGLGLTLRILLRHTRLFSLAGAVVLNASTWESRQEGTVLFRFEKHRDHPHA